MRHLSILLVLINAILTPARAASAAAPIRLEARTDLERALEPGTSVEYALHLDRGGSAEIVVLQIGIDVVVELTGPKGNSLAAIDSPNGRNGEEVVEIIAQESGDYVLRVRAIDEREPAGRYRLEVRQLRGAAATRRLLAARRADRESAGRWLGAHGMPLPSSGELPAGAAAPLDRLASRVRVLGIGEATHGSREFGDLRLSLVRYLVERQNVRVIAIEGSMSRLGLLEPYVEGRAERDAAVTRRIESGWIGRRPQRELIEWARVWNQQHPADPVRLIGLDGQDNTESRLALREFLAQAYGERLLAAWTAIEPDLVEGDAQAMVFGDSGAAPATRALLLEITAMLDLDAPLLRARFGNAAYEQALWSARQLLQAVDFNSGDDEAISHSRDWYMAVNVLRALEERGPGVRGIFWAHNAHVAHPPGTTRTSGALLRDLLGCGYGALAVTFGEGDFVAQIPNDLEDRLAVSGLPRPPEESVEGVLAQGHPEGALATWDCKVETSSLPGWLQRPQPMHWVGALGKPGSNPSEAFRPVSLIQDFDGVAYLGRVSAEEIFQDRPLVPGRARRP
jgi:erythromycin esterase